MNAEDFKKILLRVFLLSLLLSLAFYLYGLFDEFALPGVWKRLLLFSGGLGIVNLIAHFLDVKKSTGKIRYGKRFQMGGRQEVKYDYLKGRRRNLGISLSFKKFPMFIRILIKKSKAISIIIAMIFLYMFFLRKMYLKFSFDEFMLFVLLLYIPISLKLKLDSRYPVAAGLILLVACALTLAQGFGKYAERIGIYVYYCLVVGVALGFIDFLKGRKRESS